MASSTLSLCSSFSAHCKISQKIQTPQPLPITTSFLSLSSSSAPPYKLSSSSRPRFPLLTRSSETEAPVVEAEAPVVEAEFEEASEPAALEVPKREQIFAVVMVGGRQYIVIPGRFIYTQRLKGANVNDKVVLNKVLLVGTKTSAYIGKPVVTNAAVHAIVEEQGLNDKVVVFKYKKKKNYRRNIGHRQPNTRIRITGITGYQDYPAATLES